MSLIEQAVEHLQRQRPAEPAPEQVPQVLRQPAERPKDVPASGAPVELAAAPCRGDRRIQIDVPALRSAGLIAPQDEERQLAAEYRVIKRPLLAGMTGENRLRLGNILVVTSALPGEGKTFTAINLALCLALERDREVVLVDGDVAKAHLTDVFGLDGEPGLLDLGAGTCNLEDVIVRTDNASLYVLPAGSKHAEATEILRSERTTALLAALASDPRRIVLIDSPPLLVTSEAGVVSSLGGQVVMVVKAAGTPQEAVLRALENITDEKPVSLVLNQADAEHVQGYGYYGRYSYGRPDGAREINSVRPDEKK